jgi:Zn-finger nucleic acid-binding protein
MEDEKDRCGEKMPFVERAREDIYFAARDREVIEDMKAHLQKVAAAVREEHVLTCPKCSGKFQSYSFMELVLDRCESCEGIWLNKGDLDRILRRAARDPLGAFLERCFSQDETGLDLVSPARTAR